MKVYLGDDVYAKLSKSRKYLVLTAESGFPAEPLMKIYLKRSVVQRLLAFMKEQAFVVAAKPEVDAT